MLARLTNMATDDEAVRHDLHLAPVNRAWAPPCPVVYRALDKDHQVESALLSTNPLLSREEPLDKLINSKLYRVHPQSSRKTVGLDAIPNNLGGGVWLAMIGAFVCQRASAAVAQVVVLSQPRLVS